MVSILGLQINVLQIVAIAFGIGLLVFIHELGHFIFAKKFGVKVESFTIGFGPEIVGYTYKGTRYAICSVPLGGMCKMLGESIDSSTGSKEEFFSQPWYKRLMIALAGPVMNYILAVMLFGVVIYFWGVGRPLDKPVVGEVISGKPAEKAGLKSDDMILSIDGVKITTWMEMAEIIHKSANVQLELRIKREESEFDINITPELDPVSKYGLIGITPAVEIRKVSILQSINYGIRSVIFQSVFTVRYLGERLIKWEKPEIAGPIGVAQILAKAAKAGMQQMLSILAFISTALGLFNLFPIPLVDGGHIMFSIIEGITGRRLNKKIIAISNYVGLALIMTIFLFATYSDLGRLGLKLSKFFSSG
jgi:regulator of sigma E protease